MYASHALKIREHVRVGGPDAFGDVVVFVLATIRNPLWAAVAGTRSILTRDADAEAQLRRCIWGSKRDGYAFVQDREALRSLYSQARAHADAGQVDELLELLTRVPGLGLAKAGFVAQLAFGLSGCLDSHNLKRYGLAASICSIGTSQYPLTRLKRAHAYQVAVGACGGTEHLWDTWCAFVADKYPKRYRDAEHVSALHCVALGVR